MYSIREVIKLLDGYAIFSIPADVDDEILPTINSQLCEFIVQNNVLGLTFDFSNMHSTDRALSHALTQLMLTTNTLGIVTNTTGICAGIASTLTLMDADTEHIKAFGTLDCCLADLKDRSNKYQSIGTAPCQTSL